MKSTVKMAAGIICKHSKFEASLNWRTVEETERQQRVRYATDNNIKTKINKNCILNNNIENKTNTIWKYIWKFPSSCKAPNVDYNKNKTLS